VLRETNFRSAAPPLVKYKVYVLNKDRRIFRPAKFVARSTTKQHSKWLPDSSSAKLSSYGTGLASFVSRGMKRFPQDQLSKAAFAGFRATPRGSPRRFFRARTALAALSQKTPIFRRTSRRSNSRFCEANASKSPSVDPHAA